MNAQRCNDLDYSEIEMEGYEQRHVIQDLIDQLDLDIECENCNNNKKELDSGDGKNRNNFNNNKTSRRSETRVLLENVAWRETVDLSRALPLISGCFDVFLENIVAIFKVEAQWQEEERGMFTVSSHCATRVNAARNYLNSLSDDPTIHIGTVLPVHTVTVDMTRLFRWQELYHRSEDISRFLRNVLDCSVTMITSTGGDLWSCTSRNPRQLATFQDRLQNSYDFNMLLQNSASFSGSGKSGNEMHRHRIGATTVGRGREYVHVFVDASNIMINAQRIYKGHQDFTVRVNVLELKKLLAPQRVFQRGVVVGSAPAPTNPLWQYWKDEGFEVELLPKVVDSEGKLREQAIDEVLHALALQEVSQSVDGRHTLCLLTGDGNRNNGGTTFLNAVEAALTCGWKVEVWSWKQSVSSNFRKFMNHSGFSIHQLDRHRKTITFRESPGDRCFRAVR